MSQKHLCLPQRCSFPMAHVIVGDQALSVSVTITCQCGLCWYGVEILSAKNKLWRPLIPQGTLIAVSSDLAHLNSTLNRQD